MALEAKFSIPLYPYDLVVKAIFERWQGVRKGTGTGLITADRGLHLDAFMRPLVIVDTAPAVKSRLGMFKIVKAAAVEDFDLERAMEPLVLAVGLGVIGN